MSFGLNLKLARTAAGMTQKELAGRLGIAQKQLSRYERGEQAPSVEMAVKIADVLGVDMNTLTKREIINAPCRFALYQRQRYRSAPHVDGE